MCRGSEEPDLDMPELKGYDYLIDWLYDLGFSMQSPMGEMPLPISEIYSWGEKIDITHFEAKTLRDLSLCYLNMKNQAVKTNCPKPWISERERSAKLIDKKILSFFKQYEESRK